MSIRKFIAPTTRQAMKEIRDELGPDAMILSNRQTEQGVEIVAIAHGDIAHLTGGAVIQKNEWPEITADECPAGRGLSPLGGGRAHPAGHQRDRGRAGGGCR